MIIHTKNEHVNVNDNLETYIKKENKKYTLRKIAAALTVGGAIFLISSTGNIFTSKPLENPEDVKESIYSLEIPDNVKTNYYNSYKYFYSFGHSDEDAVKIDAVSDYISNSKTLMSNIKIGVKDEIKSITGTKDEIFFRQDFEGTYYITGGIHLTEKDLPKEIVDVIADIISFEKYEGDGTNSKAWDKSSDDYSRLVTQAIDEVNQISDKHYEYKDGKIIQTQKAY